MDKRQKKDLSKFIATLSNKNYAQANKYLKSVVESKIQQRISKAIKQPLF